MGRDEYVDAESDVTFDELDRYLADTRTWLVMVNRNDYLGGWVLA